VANDSVDLASAAIGKEGVATATLPESRDPKRRFEIGSVSKTLTATLLALVLGEGVLELDAPIGRWLDAGANAPVTVGELATHTSGLPAMAPNVRGTWAGYGFAEAEAGLRMSTRAPEGERGWRYSNLGYQLLALVLQRAADRSFDELLTERVLAPLGMADSLIGDGHPLGAGGVEATIDDLARYAGAVLVPPEGPLGDAVSRTLRPQSRIDAGTEQALAWIVRRGGGAPDDGGEAGHGGDVCEHSGGTAGYTACVSVSRDAGRAVALLAATGGSPALASHFKRAALLAIAGRDPSQARTPCPFPDWRERVEEAGRALIRGDVDGVYALLAAPARARVKSSDLARAWESRTREAGGATGNSDIVRQEQAVSGAMVVDLMIGFARGRVGLRTMVLPTGELGGISFLPKTD
jgi:CubicO group peptidase (beta-lactamase class C family)